MSPSRYSKCFHMPLHSSAGPGRELPRSSDLHGLLCHDVRRGSTFLLGMGYSSSRFHCEYNGDVLFQRKGLVYPFVRIQTVRLRLVRRLRKTLSQIYPTSYLCPRRDNDTQRGEMEIKKSEREKEGKSS